MSEIAHLYDNLFNHLLETMSCSLFPTQGMKQILS